ncbi:hypothetical protein ACF09L_07630 [Streptomyces sp. NPDC014779]|uniref:hypothetical protein n=1 Tax=Streptomyces sp. NPDC014779 TaxID=3364911 RepID=UPI0036F97DA4
MESAQTTPEGVPAAAPGPAVTRPEPPSVPVPADPAPTARRRGRRTLALLAAAAVLGVVGGVAVGYGVQAQREPTSLPPLNQVDLAYPAKPAAKGQEPAVLAAAADRGLRTEGDLRKLLLPKPSGAKDVPFAPDDRWRSVASYSNTFTSPSGAFEYLLDNGVRRVASTAWRVGQYKTVEINLVQFRSNDRLGAADHAAEQRGYEEDDSGYGEPIKGSTDGRTYLLPVDKEEGYLDVYEARAIFHRGDVMVQIFVTDTKKVSQKEITSLAERQLGRL